jgi:hypothetical protein
MGGAVVKYCIVKEKDSSNQLEEGSQWKRMPSNDEVSNFCHLLQCFALN